MVAETREVAIEILSGNRIPDIFSALAFVDGLDME